jgi:alpha-aminoadipate carrier protein LysW
MDSTVASVCPVCEAPLEIAAGTVVGELLQCEDCGTDLEIVGVNPYQIQEAPEVEEDWGE